MASNVTVLVEKNKSLWRTASFVTKIINST